MKPGQQLLCINNNGWINVHNPTQPTTGPRYNEVVTFLRESDPGYYVLKEYQWCNGDPTEDDYLDQAFVPLISDSELYAELEEGSLATKVKHS